MSPIGQKIYSCCDPIVTPSDKDPEEIGSIFLPEGAISHAREEEINRYVTNLIQEAKAKKAAEPHPKSPSQGAASQGTASSTSPVSYVEDQGESTESISDDSSYDDSCNAQLNMLKLADEFSKAFPSKSQKIIIKTLPTILQKMVQDKKLWTFLEETIKDFNENEETILPKVVRFVSSLEKRLNIERKKQLSQNPLTFLRAIEKTGTFLQTLTSYSDRCLSLQAQAFREVWRMAYYHQNETIKMREETRCFEDQVAKFITFKPSALSLTINDAHSKIFHDAFLKEMFLKEGIQGLKEENDINSISFFTSIFKKLKETFLFMNYPRMTAFLVTFPDPEKQKEQLEKQKQFFLQMLLDLPFGVQGWLQLTRIVKEHDLPKEKALSLYSYACTTPKELGTSTTDTLGVEMETLTLQESEKAEQAPSYDEIQDALAALLHSPEAVCLLEHFYVDTSRKGERLFLDICSTLSLLYRESHSKMQSPTNKDTILTKYDVLKMCKHPEELIEWIMKREPFCLKRLSEEEATCVVLGETAHST